MSTTTNLTQLKINYLSQSQYNTALENDEINENEIYLTPGGYKELTQAEYDALSAAEKNEEIIYLISDNSTGEIVVEDIMLNVHTTDDLYTALNDMGWL